jgi:hypothetical protein
MVAPAKKAAKRATKKPAKKTVAKRTLAKNAKRAKRTPAKRTPARRTAARKRTPAKRTPARRIPAKRTPAKRTLAKRTPAKRTPAKRTPVQKSPSLHVSPKPPTVIPRKRKVPKVTQAPSGKTIQLTKCLEGKRRLQQSVLRLAAKLALCKNKSETKGTLGKSAKAKGKMPAREASLSASLGSRSSRSEPSSTSSAEYVGPPGFYGPSYEAIPTDDYTGRNEYILNRQKHRADNEDAWFQGLLKRHAPQGVNAEDINRVLEKSDNNEFQQGRNVFQQKPQKPQQPPAKPKKRIAPTFLGL